MWNLKFTNYFSRIIYIICCRMQYILQKYSQAQFFIYIIKVSLFSFLILDTTSLLECKTSGTSYITLFNILETIILLTFLMKWLFKRTEIVLNLVEESLKDVCLMNLIPEAIILGCLVLSGLLKCRRIL